MASLEDLSSEARDELAQLARELADNPDTREAFLRLTKKARPSMNIDAIDLKDEVAARLDHASERVSHLEGKLRERDALDSLDRRRRDLIKTGKAKSEEEIVEIEKLMLEKSIANHEAAADYYNYMRQAATPTPQTSFSRNVMDDSARHTLKKFWSNPAGAARDEAAKALTEIRRNPRPIGF
jgi:hypothetical protein